MSPTMWLIRTVYWVSIRCRRRRWTPLWRHCWQLSPMDGSSLSRCRDPLPHSVVPAAFNLAALEHGEAVVASAAGLGLVPIRVGQAVQWRIFAAERPLAPSSPYEAERALNEVVIGAAATLSRLDVAAGTRPTPPIAVLLAPGYSTRQQATVERAARLLAACDAALLDDGASISSFEADRRAQELRRVRARAGEALGSAVSWLRS